jgi:hypothetical protein
MRVMVKRDDLDQFIAARTAMNPDFPDLVQAQLETNRLVLELDAEREGHGPSQKRVAAALGAKQPHEARLERGGVDPRLSSSVRQATVPGGRITPEPAGSPPERPVGTRHGAQGSSVG